MAEVKTPTPCVRLAVLSASNVGKALLIDDNAVFDPYCQVQCGNVVLRTAAEAKTMTPQWTQDFTFGIKKPLGDTVNFHVFGLMEHDRDVLLGTATLPLKTLIPDKQTMLKLKLVDAQGANCGELVVEATYEYVTLSRTDDTAAFDTDPMTVTMISDASSSPNNVMSSLDMTNERESDAVAATDVEMSAMEGTGTLLRAEKAEPVQPPNFYVVTVLEATGLLACDGTGIEATGDPYVHIKCTKNQSQQTKTQQQTLHPSWRQRFYFLVVPGEKQLLELTVNDSDLLTSDFMGHCVIDLDEFTKRFHGEKQTFWLALEQQAEARDKSAPSDLGPQRKMNYGRGKICLAIEMQYLDRNISDLAQGETDNVTEVPSRRGLWCPGKSGASEDDEGNNGNYADDTNEGEIDDGDDSEVNEKQKEAETQRKQREEKRQKTLAELSNVQFQSGDYQIRVRIIEVRDLQPMDTNGLCDPVISVECLGQRQYTVVKQKQLSCVFDEYVYFNFKKVDKETVQQGNIKISVFDADGPGLSANRLAVARTFDDLIGFFSVDIPYVYFQPDHELKRKWVALIGNGPTSSDRIQGYVLLSLLVLGPDDKMKLYDPLEDRDPDEHLVKSQADINSMVLVPPRVTQKLGFLVITIYRAEELPDMDYSMMMQGGIDGYVRAYFAGQDVLETKKVTVKGSENLTLTFNQELWFPVLLPTMSDRIFLSVWDWDMTTADQLVANILQPFSFKQVQRYPNEYKHLWANLYGPPVGYGTNSSQLQLMQNHPAHASTYRGRILLSLRVENEMQSVNDNAHVRNLLNTTVLPRMRRYTLRTALFYGTEIPVFQSKTNWNRNARMSLKISVGRHSVESSRAENLSGVCHFNQYLDIVDVELPTDLDQIPDVFVYLVRQTMNESRCICFARFKAQHLFCQDSEVLKTIAPPQWVVLHEDKVLDELEDHDFTGNILMNLRLEDSAQRERKEEEVAQQWRQHASTTVQYMKYTLFIHVFQGKCLPATDIDGLLDPYVKVFCVGSEGQVSTRISTRDPCFYETVVLDVELPQNKAFLPKVSLQVYDWDRYNADDYVGGLKFSLAELPPMSSSDYTKIRANGEYSAPRPKWFPICYEKPRDTQGELLLSFDLIKKDTPGVIVEPPESIRPPAEEVFVEIMCLGCRGLQPTGFMPINTPFIKFEIGEITKTNQPKFTNPSSKPSGRNPNFLQRIMVPVKMPFDLLFAPRLNITVYDQLFGGFYKPVIGACSINLSKKMPLSNQEPHIMYIDECDKRHGSNPYVDYDDDLSTFPGTVPSEVLQARLSSILAKKSVPDKPCKCGKAAVSLSSSFGIYGDNEDELPHYMRQRDVVDGELEDTLQSPFETYTLFRGSMPSHDECGVVEYSANTYRSVGKFKGIVRILKSRDEPPLFDLNQFLKPQTYLVRVYVLDALNLHPKDVNNRCDPYLRVSLGDGTRCEQMFNDRDNYQPETLTPKFYKMYEFKADLPGVSELKLEVLDYDSFSIPTVPSGLSKALSTAFRTMVDGDDFVGATCIDLEDRWFDAKWQELGGLTERRKPLEIRPLFIPSSTRSQGSLRLWVDILTGAEMNVAKPLDISLPPPQMFEVRVIVYKAKNVIAGDFTDLSDLFVKCWIQNRDDRSQSTDTHWRARNGRASFNWRMKFDVTLPLDPEKEADRGHLHFQMWDRDVIYDDCLADAVVDLTSFLKAAFKTKQAVSVFAKPKPVRIRGSENMPYETLSQRSGYSATEGATSVAHLQSSCSDEVVIAIANRDEKDADKKPLLCDDLTTDDNDDTEHDNMNADMENAKSLVKSFMHRLGMIDDPEDASWLTMTTRDSNTGDRVRAGELLISVEILPKHLAKVRSAGLGRGEPNNFPFLPEPADRLHLSAMWNPCYVLEALMGSKYYRTFASIFLCTIFAMLVLFAGPLINVLLTLFELIPEPFGLVFFFLVLAVFMTTLGYLIYRCRRALIRVSGGDDKKLATRSKSRKRTARQAWR